MRRTTLARQKQSDLAVGSTCKHRHRFAFGFRCLVLKNGYTTRSTAILLLVPFTGCKHTFTRSDIGDSRKTRFA
ncbi:unnamed protein product [Protopolystoma xenopodis]|uniref:Uncharacterized protein n=1 Tax=Protopolystoma xenopodis TaxID=117903 RepID=A0A3S5AU12_9PLAT|nr:unnamed protein product [Protopolystoma xenopodis]